MPDEPTTTDQAPTSTTAEDQVSHLYTCGAHGVRHRQDYPAGQTSAAPAGDSLICGLPRETDGVWNICALPLAWSAQVRPASLSPAPETVS